MSFSELITTLVKQGVFVDADDAERALTTTFETLGFTLPARLVRELESALPEQCGWPLAFGLSVAENQQRGGQGAKPSAPHELPGHTLERVQEVAKGLVRTLPSALVASIERELPQQLRGAFQPRRAESLPSPVRGLQGAIAGGRPGSLHPVSEAATGSRRPLSTSRPAPARSAALGEVNPHGDTKLSSAHGTTQEREHETIATAYRDR